MSANQTFRRNSIDNQEDRFVCRHQVPSLQEMASHAVTKAIWLHDTNAPIVPGSGISGQRSYCYCHCINKFCCRCVDGFLDGSLHLIQHLKVPAAIEKILRNSLRNINRQTLCWGNHLYEIAEKHQCITSDYEIHHNDPNWCVWSWNGEIDFRKSMKNMLEVGGLTEYQKFFFMTEFCTEDEIKTFPLDSIPPEIISNVDFFKCSVCFYWICYLKNELHKIPVENTDSVDYNMAANYFHSSFVAEYFANRLNDESLARIFSGEIREMDGYRIWIRHIFLARILSKMSWYQQQCLLSEMWDMIIIAFALFSDSPQIALWAWRNSKDQMTADRFTELIIQILEKGRYYGYLVNTSTFTFSLCEIWDTASDYQRNHAIQTNSDNFICESLCCPCLPFLEKFLNLMPLEERKKWIYSKVEHDIVYQCDAPIIDILLPCTDDQLKFRKMMADSPDFRWTLHRALLELSFYEVDQLLCFISPDTWRVFKQTFLKEESTRRRVHMNFITFITDINRWNAFSTFIDEIFEPDLGFALNVKKRFIEAFAATIVYPEMFRILGDGFDDLVKIVEMMFSGKELRTVKKLFSRYHCQLIGRFEPTTALIFSTTGFESFLNSDDNKFHPKFQQWYSI